MIVLLLLWQGTVFVVPPPSPPQLPDAQQLTPRTLRTVERRAGW